jgi:hypothetical protein
VKIFFLVNKIKTPAPGFEPGYAEANKLSFEKKHSSRLAQYQIVPRWLNYVIFNDHL